MKSLKSAVVPSLRTFFHTSSSYSLSGPTIISLSPHAKNGMSSGSQLQSLSLATEFQGDWRLHFRTLYYREQPHESMGSIQRNGQGKSDDSINRFASFSVEDYGAFVYMHFNHEENLGLLRMK